MAAGPACSRRSQFLRQNGLSPFLQPPNIRSPAMTSAQRNAGTSSTLLLGERLIADVPGYRGVRPHGGGIGKIVNAMPAEPESLGFEDGDVGRRIKRDGHCVSLRNSITQRERKDKRVPVRINSWPCFAALELPWR